MLERIVNRYVNSDSCKENIGVFVEINRRFIKEVQEKYAVVIVEFIQNFIFEQREKIVLHITPDKIKELNMSSSFVDLTANTTRSIALDPHTGVFTIDISINGRGGPYTFNSKDILIIDLVVINSDGLEERLPIEDVLTSIHGTVMTPTMNNQEVSEELPANVVRGNFGK